MESKNYILILPFFPGKFAEHCRDDIPLRLAGGVAAGDRHKLQFSDGRIVAG